MFIHEQILPILRIIRDNWYSDITGPVNDAEKAQVDELILDLETMAGPEAAAGSRYRWIPRLAKSAQKKQLGGALLLHKRQKYEYKLAKLKALMG